MENPQIEENPYESPEFKTGLDVGDSLGQYKAWQEAKNAYDAGEIELWLEFNTPRSMEEWKVWEAEHGPTDTFADRWKK